MNLVTVLPAWYTRTPEQVAGYPDAITSLPNFDRIVVALGKGLSISLRG
jgi:hypothetical protein